MYGEDTTRNMALQTLVLPWVGVVPVPAMSMVLLMSVFAVAWTAGGTAGSFGRLPSAFPSGSGCRMNYWLASSRAERDRAEVPPVNKLFLPAVMKAELLRKTLQNTSFTLRAAPRPSRRDTPVRAFKSSLM